MKSLTIPEYLVKDPFNVDKSCFPASTEAYRAYSCWYITYTLFFFTFLSPYQHINYYAVLLLQIFCASVHNLNHIILIDNFLCICYVDLIHKTCG